MLNVLAGGDTSSATMRAVVYYLAKTPHAYRKLISELDAANLSMPAQWRDVKDLPYLDAVMREAWRMNPGIAMIFERVVGSVQGLSKERYNFVDTSASGPGKRSHSKRRTLHPRRNKGRHQPSRDEP